VLIGRVNYDIILAWEKVAFCFLFFDAFPVSNCIYLTSKAYIELYLPNASFLRCSCSSIHFLSATCCSNDCKST